VSPCFAGLLAGLLLPGAGFAPPSVPQKSIRGAGYAGAAALRVEPRDTAQDEDSLPKSVRRLSKYERQSVADLLPSGFAEVEPAPEGKVVESIEIRRLDVLEARDPLPRFVKHPLNAIHTTTKDSIVRREIILREGSAFAQVDLDETERNLRKLSQLSVVVGLPLRGSTPGTVRIFVVTKDTWSLRLNNEISVSGNGSGAGIETLTLRPTETNLFGLHHTAGLAFSYLPESFALGALYKVPRFGSSYVGASAATNVFFNNDRGTAEGFSLEGKVGQPLYTTRTEWGWGALGEYVTNVKRRYSNTKLLRFGPAKIPSGQRVPFQYEQEIGRAGVEAVRSFGWRTKNDISAGFAVDARNYRTFDLTPYAPEAVLAFRKLVPTSDTRLGPSLTYHGYTTRFHRVTDFETLALQEDLRLGHDVYARVYPITEALGSSRTFLGAFASAQYTVPLGDGLARASVEAFAELGADTIYDSAIEARLRAVTPKLGFGRVVFDANVYRRFDNYLKTTRTLGGETRLRGYPTGAFIGQDSVLYNLEFRTRPLQFWSLALGFAAFYDVGDAFDGVRNFRPKQSTGAGFRLLIPQLNRTVFRGDLGFPLTRPLPTGTPPVAFFFGFDQAFELGSAGPL
jgi:hypothetical protein